MTLRDLVPPAARGLFNRLAGAATTYRGPYPDWQSAVAASIGYDDVSILARVSDATAKVLRGEADYEQDGIAKRGPVPPSSALDALLQVAALDDGRLSVLDFGGSLGSHFLRWRAQLARLERLHWCVVEQPSYVAAGAELFARDTRVSFAGSIEGARAREPNVVLASSVLQYLPDPGATLRQLIAVSPRAVILDRMPMSEDATPRVLTQHTPRSLGRASYPLWVMPRAAIYAELRERYDLVAEFPPHDARLHAGPIRCDYGGCFWMRKN